MSKPRSTNITARPTPASPRVLHPAHGSAPQQQPGQGWVRFWFTPTDPIGLHIVRILGGLLFLGWLLSFLGHVDALHGLQGWFDRQAYGELPALPDGAPVPISWSILYPFGADSTALHGVYVLSLLMVGLFTAGVATRITAPLSWLVVASFTANPAASYDGDALLLILAFYLMAGYVLFGLWPTGQSLLAYLFGPMRTLGLGVGPEARRPSLAANVALRLLQVHFAVVIVVSGVHKLQSGDWWSGSAMWYPLYPPLSTTLEQARLHAAHPTLYLTILSLAAYATLAWQLAFPLFAWRRGWCRLILLGGAALGWLSTAFVWDLPWFGPAYFIAALCFISADEWRRLFARVAGLFTPSASARGEVAAVAAGRSR